MGGAVLKKKKASEPSWRLGTVQKNKITCIVFPDIPCACLLGTDAECPFVEDGAVRRKGGLGALLCRKREDGERAVAGHVDRLNGAKLAKVCLELLGADGAAQVTDKDVLGVGGNLHDRTLGLAGGRLAGHAAAK